MTIGSWENIGSCVDRKVLLMLDEGPTLDINRAQIECRPGLSLTELGASRHDPDVTGL